MRNSFNTNTGYFKKYTITIITVAFGFQLIRVLLVSLVGYLRDSVGVGSLDLAPIAIGIFAIGFLAGVIWKFAGPSKALWISAGGVAIIRLAEQVSISPNLDYYLSAAGVALFLMYVPKGLALTRQEGEAGSTQFGYAFLIGIATDTALHVGGRTLDLSWQTGFAPIAIVALLAAASLYSISKSTAQIKDSNHLEGHWSGGSALFALGPWMLLQMLVFQNVARVSSLTGWETPLAGGLVILGNALGLGLAALLAASGRNAMKTTLAVGLLLTVSLLVAEPTQAIAALQLLLGHVLSIVLVITLFAGFGRGKNTHGIARATIASGFGMILFVLFMFVYYVTYDISFGFRSFILLPVLAILVYIGALLSSRGAGKTTDSTPNYAPAKSALVFLIVPIILTFFWNTNIATSAPAGNKEVRVMTYNLHNGVNTDGRLDLEALAVVIEESGADVIGLQEVSRGWLIWGSTDMLTWLSQRLGMPYFYGPTGDAQWGNAILSRYPILDATNVTLEPADLLLRRGYITATIDIGGGVLTVIDTHFTHVDEHSAERDIQTSQIIDAWNGAAATVFMGDLNARPDENAIAILVNAGWIDISAMIGTAPVYTFPANAADHQIDYIFASGDLSYVDFLIPTTSASDHLPLVVTIILP